MFNSNFVFFWFMTNFALKALNICKEHETLFFTSTQLHPPPPSSLQHPQQYLNQNIAHNWAISPNLGWKIKSCPFWLKTGTHGTLEMLIPNPALGFWNSDPKIHFWANLSPNIQSCPFFLKIGTHSISTMLIPNPDLDFWNFDPKTHFWANLGPKSQSCPSGNCFIWYHRDADSYSNISFPNLKS